MGGRGGGGCCIARYADGSLTAAYEMSKVDRIMLRFRPIAPKPAKESPDSGASLPDRVDTYVKAGRGKRRYARNNNNSDNNGSASRKGCGSRKRKSSSPEGDDKTVSGGDTVVTLPLLPETPERKDSSARGSLSSGGDEGRKGEKESPVWLSFGEQKVVQHQHQQPDGHVVHVTVVPQPVSVVGSWVRIECITNTWVDLYGLGCTDEERLMNLDRDGCPGFLSDGLNRVQWTNRAYREMALHGGGGEDGQVVVWLEFKEGVELPVMGACWAFTCSVRLVTCGKEKSSLTLPCDVWRMDCGGFAWRLDVKAALSLGR